MTAVTTFLLLAAVAAVCWRTLVPSQLPLAFRARSCQGKLWKNAFPSSTKEELRDFLYFFAAAFAFSNKHMLRFSPSDTILQIYRALYPSKWTPDALEVETLARDFESKYGVHFEDIWHDELSLGELFLHSRRSIEK
jgi:hypothetical protein